MEEINATYATALWVSALELDWNVMLGKFATFEDAPYRIYRITGLNESLLLGCGKTPQEAVTAMVQGMKPKGGSGVPNRPQGS